MPFYKNSTPEGVVKGGTPLTTERITTSVFARFQAETWKSTSIPPRPSACCLHMFKPIDFTIFPKYICLLRTSMRVHSYISQRVPSPAEWMPFLHSWPNMFP